MIYDNLGERKYLTIKEHSDFLEALELLPFEHQAFCRCLAFTGCRLSEALQITPRAVDTEIRTVRVRTLKKRAGSHVRAAPVSKAFLDDLVRIIASESLDRDDRLWPWSRTTAWKVVKLVMSLARLDGVAATPKGLRHSFDVQAIQSGVALNIVKRWLGHSRIETTANYTNALGDEERRIAERLWQAWAG